MHGNRVIHACPRSSVVMDGVRPAVALLAFLFLLCLRSAILSGTNSVCPVEKLDTMCVAFCKLCLHRTWSWSCVHGNMYSLVSATDIVDKTIVEAELMKSHTDDLETALAAAREGWFLVTQIGNCVLISHGLFGYETI